MEISDETLNEFIRIYEKELGEKLSEEAAREIASRLLTLYELLLKRPPRRYN